jgi:hypothetical protein
MSADSARFGRQNAFARRIIEEDRELLERLAR